MMSRHIHGSIMPIIPSRASSSSFSERYETLWRQTLPSCTAGTITFYGTLAVSTLVQWKILGVSTGTLRPIPSLLGMTSVALASVASHTATIQVFTATAKKNHLKYGLNHHHQQQYPYWQHTLRVCTTGLIIFKLLGGRFWSISPSSFTHLGSFARPIVSSISASNAYANTFQRQQIEVLGRRYGCHTCGSRMLFVKKLKGACKFHADHMPPQSVVECMNKNFVRRLLNVSVKQRFYPQCITCSNKQGGILSKATKSIQSGNKKYTFFSWKKGPVQTLMDAGGGQEAYFHGLRFRFSHLTGFLLGALTVVDTDVKDVMGKGNEQRFKSIQDQVVTRIKTLL